MTGKSDWTAALRARARRLDSDPDMPPGMPAANIDMVDRVLRGIGPDSSIARAGSGAHAVANMASEHAPAFCSASARGAKAYLNAYDLAAVKPVGRTRQRVDAALPLPAGETPDNLYFLAVEVNGTGMRFYGDLCLVLRSTDSRVRVLNGNSYDLVRLPMSARTATDTDLAGEAATYWGEWGKDLAAMGALKTFAARRGERRLTTAQVSDAILEDEDYLEVLRIGSFAAGDLHEVRLSMASVVAEADITERMRHGATPSAAALLWRKRRRDAVAAFDAAGVPIRIVTDSGRDKG